MYCCSLQSRANHGATALGEGEEIGEGRGGGNSAIGSFSMGGASPWE
jgi:hypothetical protein